jgi:ABC-type proline/glycine betaine transport system ATPase subunit
VALGNPALPDGTTVQNAVSEGIVSNPKTDYASSFRLVADIAIASGSSGGPIISKETGEIVGVVVAVAAPRLSRDGVSSSGYFCLAAPADMLHEWLGLEYAGASTTNAPAE